MDFGYVLTMPIVVTKVISSITFEYKETYIMQSTTIEYNSYEISTTVSIVQFNSGYISLIIIKKKDQTYMEIRNQSGEANQKDHSPIWLFLSMRRGCFQQSKTIKSQVPRSL